VGHKFYKMDNFSTVENIQYHDDNETTFVSTLGTIENDTPVIIILLVTVYDHKKTL
jgi:hypothetical protein